MITFQANEAELAYKNLKRLGVHCSLFRIRKTFFGSSDPYPDFKDPDPTHLPAIVNKNNNLEHHITDKKSANKFYREKRKERKEENCGLSIW